MIVRPSTPEIVAALDNDWYRQLPDDAIGDISLSVPGSGAEPTINIGTFVDKSGTRQVAMQDLGILQQVIELSDTDYRNRKDVKCTSVTTHRLNIRTGTQNQGSFSNTILNALCQLATPPEQREAYNRHCFTANPQPAHFDFTEPDQLSYFAVSSFPTNYWRCPVVKVNGDSKFVLVLNALLTGEQVAFRSPDELTTNALTVVDGSFLHAKPRLPRKVDRAFLRNLVSVDNQE